MKSVLVLLFTYLFSLAVCDVDPLVLSATVYDQRNCDAGGANANPDFNCFGGTAPTTGMVAEYLDENNNPVLIDTKGKLTSFDTWNRWWNYDPFWNIQLEVTIVALWDATKKAYTFSNTEYFPIDGQGWDLIDGKQFVHNYGFCMEIHNQFTYQKGQVFDFTGDDDVWVFIDKKLCLDLGGPHPPMSGSIELDNLGLTEGWVYAFDMFYCERHRDGSSLKFTTSIELSPCGKEDSDKDSTADLCDYCPFGDPELSLTESGSGLTRAFYLTLGTEVRDGLELSFDFGDGKTTEVYTAIDTTIVHSYEKAGTYEVTVSSAPLAGCASSIDTLTVTLTSEGTRIAPKCSSIPLMPGSDGGLQRRK
jgi:fibro-slime domain-containing protein